MGSMSRTKGQIGERELLKWLHEKCALGKLPQRNYKQASVGGSDCVDIPGYSIEVKRQEELCIPAWWEQCVRQAINEGQFPILAYRQNRKKWFFCLPATLINTDSWGYITLTDDEFASWFRKRLHERES